MQSADYRFGRLIECDRNGSDPQFAPRGDHHWFAGDGHLLSVVYRGVQNRSDLALLGAGNVADGTVACGELPRRVPYPVPR